MQQAAHVASNTETKRRAVILAFILTFAFRAAASSGPPEDLVRRVAARETENAAARDNYTYRQTVEMDELDSRGAIGGMYHEVRDVIFSPTHERTDEFVGKPRNTLRHLILTDEDFRDIRNIQPFLLTSDRLFLYETKFRGDENIDGVDYWVLQIEPRQILEGQRLFKGLLWIDKNDFSIVRSEGQAVPQILSMKQENLFPHFTTIREKIDGTHWFPVKTYGQDTLPFRTGGQRVRLVIDYSHYQRFGADSTIIFGPKK